MDKKTALAGGLIRRFLRVYTEKLVKNRSLGKFCTLSAAWNQSFYARRHRCSCIAQSPRKTKILINIIIIIILSYYYTHSVCTKPPRYTRLQIKLASGPNTRKRLLQYIIQTCAVCRCDSADVKVKREKHAPDGDGCDSTVLNFSTNQLVVYFNQKCGPTAEELSWRISRRLLCCSKVHAHRHF